MEINPQQIYTDTEVQIILRVSRSTLKRRRDQGLIQYSKVKGSIKYLGVWLLEYLDANKKEGFSSFIYQSKSIKLKSKSIDLDDGSEAALDIPSKFISNSVMQF